MLMKDAQGYMYLFRWLMLDGCCMVSCYPRVYSVFTSVCHGVGLFYICKCLDLTSLQF